jgi:hypothetical protein
MWCWSAGAPLVQQAVSCGVICQAIVQEVLVSFPNSATLELASWQKVDAHVSMLVAVAGLQRRRVRSQAARDTESESDRGDDGSAAPYEARYDNGAHAALW